MFALVKPHSRFCSELATNFIVFPIQVKILKPGFRVAEQRNPGKPVSFRVFEMNAILSDKKSISV